MTSAGHLAEAAKLNADGKENQTPGTPGTRGGAGWILQSVRLIGTLPAQPFPADASLCQFLVPPDTYKKGNRVGRRRTGWEESRVGKFSLWEK